MLLPGTDHRPRKRVRPETEPVEQLEAGRHCIVGILVEFLQDDLSLTLEFIRGEAAVANDVAQHADKILRMFSQPVHVECGVVLVGMRIDLGAELLGIEIDLLATALLGAFERHVFDKMADAVQPLRFMQAAAADKHADRCRQRSRQPDRHNPNAVRQRDDVGVGGLACH